MKKFLCIVLTFAMALALCACGSNPQSVASPPPTSSNDSNNEPSATAAPEPSEWDFSNDKSVNLTFATYLSETDPSTLMLIEYMDKIKEATEIGRASCRERV